jgi:hypothetical protein
MMDENNVVFVDEFGVDISIRLAYGRSEVGTVAKKIVRSIRSKNFSVSAAISRNGLVHLKH